MRLTPSDPDVATIVARIMNGDMDLQPDFQRGEVWSDSKKRRLIDSILRDWHIPPIHVIEVEDSAIQEVLDGQQRLVAIRDFVKGAIRVDGSTEPSDEEISQLDGVLYADLPPKWKRRFDQFTIRVFRITDYSPEEPGELFFRLNQPTSLTAAEQRNAFFGPVRKQIKELVQFLTACGIDKTFIGFSNSRMAYDDVIAKLCYSLEEGTLAKKVTAGTLTHWYRSTEPFSDETIGHCKRAVSLLGDMKPHLAGHLKFNKATLHSWLWFLADGSKAHWPHFSPIHLAIYLLEFESYRILATTGDDLEPLPFLESAVLPPKFVRQLLTLYSDRARARVADISSVLARDATIWLLFIAHLTKQGIEIPSECDKIAAVREIVRDTGGDLSTLDAEKMVDVLVAKYDWGRF